MTALSYTGRPSRDQALLESQWSADDALDWAIARWHLTRRWPLRRFRVVVHFGGVSIRSRLLTSRGVASTHARFGGTVEELIPGRQEYLERAKDAAA